MSRTMFDAIIAGNPPAGAPLYAGYDDGSWPDAAALAARFPGAIVVRVTVSAGDNEGQVLDVETGDATPAQAVGWVGRRRAAGVDPTVYCNTSTWPAVQAAFAAAGVPQPHYWVAQYDGDPTIPAGAVAKQYESNADYDTSVVADYWPGVDPAPTHLTKEIIMSGFIAAITPSGGQNPGIWMWLDGHYAGFASPADASEMGTALGLPTVTLSVGTHENLVAATQPGTGSGAAPAQVASAVLAAEGAADTAAAKA